jgi:NADPH:quinone reductase
MLQRIVRSTIVDAPLERVWAVLRDFNSHDQWHDVVDQSRIERSERGDQVGCIRAFTLKDGNRIREQLLTLDDRDHKSTYCIVDASVPLQRYVATITLKRVTDSNRTFWHWESTFATPPGMERELSDMVATQVYEAGFEHLRNHLRRGGDLRTGVSENFGMPAALPIANRRVVVSAYGDANALRAETAETAAPVAGEVRIRQRAIGVNFFDIYLRRGWMPDVLPLPGVLGMEAAGTVLDVGAGVHGLIPGDRVAYMWSQPGSYSTVRCVPADQVLRLPPSVEFDVAAALLLKGITADYLLRDLGRITRGTRLLVHAAAGGLGLLVCAWAKHLGAEVIGTVSSPEKARVAREYGCERVIVTADYRFAPAVQEMCGGVDVLIDGLGEAARQENYAALARRGHWISIGQASGALKPLATNELVAKSLTFSQPVAFDYVATRAELVSRAERLWAALADGTIRMPPIERYSLEAAAQAHERLEQRRTTGALVLTA